VRRIATAGWRPRSGGHVASARLRARGRAGCRARKRLVDRDLGCFGPGLAGDCWIFFLGGPGSGGQAAARTSGDAKNTATGHRNGPVLIDEASLRGRGRVKTPFSRHERRVCEAGGRKCPWISRGRPRVATRFHTVRRPGGGGPHRTHDLRESRAATRREPAGFRDVFRYSRSCHDTSQKEEAT